MFFGLLFFIFGLWLVLEGSIVYIVNYVFVKSLFFFVVGVLSYSCGMCLLLCLCGVLYILLLLGVGFCVVALVIIGVLLFNGFFSKFLLFVVGFVLLVEYWILLFVMIFLMIELVVSFVWFICWFGCVVFGKLSEVVVDVVLLLGLMCLVLIVLIVMLLIFSVIVVIWL